MSKSGPLHSFTVLLPKDGLSELELKKLSVTKKKKAASRRKRVYVCDAVLSVFFAMDESAKDQLGRMLCEGVKVILAGIDRRKINDVDDLRSFIADQRGLLVVWKSKTEGSRRPIELRSASSERY